MVKKRKLLWSNKEAGEWSVSTACSFFGVPHKYIELQIAKWAKSWSWFDITVRWSYRVDHAGFMVSISIWKFLFGLQIYDHRHWDIEKDCWEKEL
jgi:hypothetical protein